MITALHAPQHMSQGLDANLDTILRLKPTVVNLTEQDNGSHDNVARIERHKIGKSYHVLAPPVNGDDRSRENIILLRKQPWRRVTRVAHYKLSDFIEAAGGNPGIGSDRHMVVVEWLDFGHIKRAHVATHWNAVIQSKDSGALLPGPRAAAMNENAGPLLEEVLRNLKKRGYSVTGGADFNFADRGKNARSWRYAPANIFAATRYNWRSHGLDYQWWTPDYAPLTQTTILAGQDGNNSDHPWLLTTLKKGLRE